MSSRIEQIIDEIEEYIDRDCKFQPLSTTKIIVNKEHLDELLRELRMKTPDEIKRYQKIIANRDAILADAKAKADAMIEEAQVQTTELVSEHEIMQQAYAQANETINSANQQAQAIIDAATNDANALRLSAVSYTDELMGNMGQIASSMLENAAGKYNEFVQALQASLDVIRQNRAELAPQLQGAASVQTAAPAQDPAQEDYQEEEPVEYEDDDEYDDEYDDLDDDFDDFDE